MSKILLTGSTGFLGRIVQRELEKQSQSILTLGRNAINNIQCDLALGSIKLPKDIDVVVHCAGMAHIVPRNEVESNSFFKVNVEGTRNLLNSLEDCNNLKSFIFISSVSVYGLNHGQFVSETFGLNASDPYGLSKVKAELDIKKWCNAKDLNCLILRLPLLIGENAPGNLASIIRAIKKGFYFNINRGQNRKSMVLAEDVALFICKSFGKSGIYNLTDNCNPSVYEFSKVIANHYKVKNKNMPIQIALLLAKIGDIIGPKFPINSGKLEKLISELTFDCSLARNEINWNPRPVLKEINRFL